MKKEITEFSTRELISEWWDRFFENFVEKYFFIVLFFLVAIPFMFVMLKGFIEWGF